MSQHFVQVLSDVYCDWEGLEPVYRVYVNDELFTERNWRWEKEYYLEELLQIEAEPGEYTIRYELVPPHLATLEVKNTRIKYGPGAMLDGNILRINDESK